MFALEIKNLTKTYANGVRALKGVDLQVSEGEFFALLGPNGAGKTTTINILSSLVNKTSGQINIFEHDLDTDVIAAKSSMGLVPQEFNFNQFEKVIDIVVNQAGFYGIPRKIAFSRAEYYLQQLGLWEKRNQVSRTLSGGMKRRLMIARALVHEPRMLILDEPTANVDIELRRATWDFLKKINKEGTTIILTTHNLEEAEILCHGMAIIDKGVILENNLIKNLITQLEYEAYILDLTLPKTSIPKIDGLEMNLIDATTLEIAFPKDRTLNEVFDQLMQHGIQVHSMRNKTNRLEELFLKKIQFGVQDSGVSNAS
jgi:ABC-2 type transport system ATP-binding protein